MSTTFKKTIGYGLPMSEFKKHSIARILDENSERENLYRLFISAPRAIFQIPDRLYNEFYYKRKNTPPILFDDLLNLDVKERDADDVRKGFANELYEYVHSYDEEPTDIIFYPSLGYKRTWFRRGDDIDYAFERWADGTDIKTEGKYETFCKYVAFGHYPLSNNLMLADGTPHPWEPFHALQKRTDLFPAVPLEIRYYLSVLKVLDEEGINKIRPCIAQWWS